jgi:mutator protein MutT
MINVVAGIVVRDGKMLMGRRHGGDTVFNGYWEFPGGKQEANENPEQALAREFLEELGIAPVSMKEVDSFVWSYPTKQVGLRFFQVELPPFELSDLTLDSHTEFGWLSLETALQSQLLPANIFLLQKPAVVSALRLSQ